MSRRVVLAPLPPGTPRSVQDRSIGSSGSGFAVLESDDEAADMESDSETGESDTESIVPQEEEEDVAVPFTTRLRCQKPGCHDQSVKALSVSTQWIWAFCSDPSIWSRQRSPVKHCASFYQRSKEKEHHNLPPRVSNGGLNRNDLSQKGF